jgi:hypothetical protein
MDDILIMAFLQMLGEKPLSLKRLPNGYCGDQEESNCSICKQNPWWDIEFQNVGTITIGWRKRVIQISWEKTGRRLEDGVTQDNVTRTDTMIHAWGYSDALKYLGIILLLLRIQKRDEKNNAV